MTKEDKAFIKENNYKLEINFNHEYNRWECDCIDKLAKEYVFYPCIRVYGRKNKNEAETIAINAIRNKVKLNNRNDHRSANPGNEAFQAGFL